MTAAEVIAEVKAAGGCLVPAGGRLRWRMPVQPPVGLVEAIRERKPDLLMLLRYPATECLACGGDRFRPDAVGVWRCERCEPEGAPDPFGPLPAGEAEALAELELRRKLREPKYAAIIARNTGDGTPRSLAIRAAAAVWAQRGPEGIARRRAEAFRGVPPGLVAGRQVDFRAPEGLPGPGEWVGISAGNAEVLGWDLARGEALVRLLAAAAWRWIPMRSLGEPRRF